MTADRTDASICIGCGLCCDGTILTHLAVRDESDLGAPLMALGVEVLVAAEPPVVELPCPAVVGGVCAVYDRHRPHACEAFECALGRAVGAGDITPAHARRTIARTKELRAEVEAGRADPSDLRRWVDRHFRGVASSG